jgi:hypothetical protein
MELRTGNVSANGIDFHYIEMGAGPLVLCLHGFPDCAYTYSLSAPGSGGGRLSRSRAFHARLRADRESSG